MADSNWRICPILGVPDVRAAVDFYTKSLGFALSEGGIFAGVGEGEGGVYAIVLRDQSEIHLQIRRIPYPERKRESHESDAYLFVSDADALFEEYESRGVTILRGLQDEPYGLRDFTIEDAFGHRLVFGTPL